MGDKVYKKSCNIAFELYTDNQNDMDFLNSMDLHLRANSHYVAHFYMLHDSCVVLPCDVDEDIARGKIPRELGSPKKPHYHVLVIYDYQRPGTAVMNELFHDRSRYCELVNSRDKYIQYLTHEDDSSVQKGKKVYPRDKVYASDKDMYTKAMNTLQSEDFSRQDFNLSVIYEYIEDKGIVKYYSLVRYCIQMGISEYLRRNYSIIRDLIYEHNENIINSEKEFDKAVKRSKGV